jgi:hypothetical protein
VRNLASIVCGIALLAVIPGCDFFGPSPATVMKNVVAAENDLTEALKAVRDAESAKAAIPNVEKKFEALTAVTTKFGEILRSEQKSGMDEKAEMQALNDIQAASARLKSEQERVSTLPGLPIEFWKMMTTRAVESALATFEAAPMDQAPQLAEAIQFLKDVQSLYQTHPFEQVLNIELVNVRPDMIQTVRDRVSKLAPGATIYRSQFASRVQFVFGPVKDFNEFVSAIDFGTVSERNDTKRHVKINVDIEQLDPSIKARREETERLAKEIEEREKEAAERDKREREERDRKAKEFLAKGGVHISPFVATDPSDPKFYDKLADVLLSGDRSEVERAAEVLLQHTPAEVASAEVKKKIARGFKQLAEDEHGPAKKKAIRGLVIWGGKYSGPILLRMLNDSHSFDDAEVIKALGEIKYGPAALAIAARLGNHFSHDCAFTALQDLGPAAEDALVRVALSEDPKVCLAAVDLLAENGTEKCLPLLSKGFSSRNLMVREACKEAIRKVKARLKEGKDDGKDDGKDSGKIEWN